jgi:Mg-chelatase subunit ChlI
MNINDNCDDLKQAHLEISELRVSNAKLRAKITELVEQLSDRTHESRLEKQIAMLQAKLKVSERENDLLTLDIQQLHQAISVLNDEPTNSL